MDNDDINVKAQNGFSLMGLFFGPYYYAGYGKLKQGIFMSILTIIPLGWIVVGIYCGFCAKKDLKIKQIEFKWFNVFIVVIIIFTIGVLISILSNVMLRS